jgi:hypothetical protein
VDAVAAGLGADVDDRVADAARPAVEDAVGADDAAGEGVDEDVAVVGAVEGELAADGRDADAVAVAADAGDDAAEEGRGARVVGAAEAEGVEVGDGPGAHGEDVAEDAADPGGRALVGLDEGGVVVRLHLEDGGEAVPDVDHAGVLPGALDDAGALGGQAGEVDAGALVRAVLAPHHAEHAELGVRRLAAEPGHDAGVLLRRELVRSHELGRDRRVAGEGPGGALVCHRAGW